MNPVPDTIIRLVKQNKIILTKKAQDQANNSRFDIEDLINSILNGQVAKKEIDETKRSKYKFSIIGPAISGIKIYSCGKIVKFKEKMYMVITYHETR